MCLTYTPDWDGDITESAVWKEFRKVSFYGWLTIINMDNSVDSVDDYSAVSMLKDDSELDSDVAFETLLTLAVEASIH